MSLDSQACIQLNAQVKMVIDAPFSQQTETLYKKSTSAISIMAKMRSVCLVGVKIHSKNVCSYIMTTNENGTFEMQIYNHVRHHVRAAQQHRRCPSVETQTSILIDQVIRMLQ